MAQVNWKMGGQTLTLVQAPIGSFKRHFQMVQYSRTGHLAYTDGVGQLGNGLNQMAGQLPNLVSGVNQLNNGFWYF